MAKKTTPKKRSHKKKTTNGAVRQTRKQAEGVLRKGAIRTKAPRSVPLPGMEDARIGALDDELAAIADIREQKNELRTQETEHMRTTLKLMREHGKTSWRHAGVEAARVPGEEKLRVRTSKEKATAEVEDEDDETVEISAMDAEEGTDDVAAETGATAQ